MGPSAVFGEKYGKGREVFLISIVAIFLGFLLMGFSSSVSLFTVGVVLFFIGFNMFEPLLQSFVSKTAKIHQKGTALGVANTFAYVGIFFGGILGGFVMDSFDRQTLTIIVAMLSILWFVWILGMNNPSARANIYLDLSVYEKSKILSLEHHEAVFEIYFNETENIGVIKYEKALIDEDTLRGMIRV